MRSYGERGRGSNECFIYNVSEKNTFVRTPFSEFGLIRKQTVNMADKIMVEIISSTTKNENGDFSMIAN